MKANPTRPATAHDTVEPPAPKLLPVLAAGCGCGPDQVDLFHALPGHGC